MSEKKSETTILALSQVCGFLGVSEEQLLQWYKQPFIQHVLPFLSIEGTNVVIQQDSLIESFSVTSRESEYLIVQPEPYRISSPGLYSYLDQHKVPITHCILDDEGYADYSKAFDFQQDQYVVVNKGAINSKKTRSILEFVKANPKQIVYIVVPSKMLSFQLSADLNIANYLDIKGKESILGSKAWHDSVVVCALSVTNITKPPDMLVIDEACDIVDQLQRSSFLGTPHMPDKERVFVHLIALIRHTPRVVLMDAFVSVPVLELVRRAGRLSETIVLDTYSKYRPCIDIGSDYISFIQNAIEADENIFVFFGSKKKCEETHHFLLEKYGSNHLDVGLYVSTEDGYGINNLHEYQQSQDGKQFKHNVGLATYALKSGFNIVVENHYSKVLFVGSYNVGNVRDFLQSVNRVRFPIEPEIYVCLKGMRDNDEFPQLDTTQMMIQGINKPEFYGNVLDLGPNKKFFQQRVLNEFDQYQEFLEQENRCMGKGKVLSYLKHFFVEHSQNREVKSADTSMFKQVAKDFKIEKQNEIINAKYIAPKLRKKLIDAKDAQWTLLLKQEKEHRRLRHEKGYLFDEFFVSRQMMRKTISKDEAKIYSKIAQLWDIIFKNTDVDEVEPNLRCAAEFLMGILKALGIDIFKPDDQQVSYEQIEAVFQEYNEHRYTKEYVMKRIGMAKTILEYQEANRWFSSLMKHLGLCVERKNQVKEPYFLILGHSIFLLHQAFDRDSNIPQRFLSFRHYKVASAIANAQRKDLEAEAYRNELLRLGFNLSINIDLHGNYQKQRQRYLESEMYLLEDLCSLQHLFDEFNNPISSEVLSTLNRLKFNKMVPVSKDKDVQSVMIDLYTLEQYPISKQFAQRVLSLLDNTKIPSNLYLYIDHLVELCWRIQMPKNRMSSCSEERIEAIRSDLTKKFNKSEQDVFQLLVILCGIKKHSTKRLIRHLRLLCCDHKAVHTCDGFIRTVFTAIDNPITSVSGDIFKEKEQILTQFLLMLLGVDLRNTEEVSYPKIIDYDRQKLIFEFYQCNQVIFEKVGCANSGIQDAQELLLQVLDYLTLPLFPHQILKKEKYIQVVKPDEDDLVKKILEGKKNIQAQILSRLQYPYRDSDSEDNVEDNKAYKKESPLFTEYHPNLIFGVCHFAYNRLLHLAKTHVFKELKLFRKTEMVSDIDAFYQGLTTFSEQEIPSKLRKQDFEPLGTSQIEHSFYQRLMLNTIPSPPKDLFESETVWIEFNRWKRIYAVRVENGKATMFEQTLTSHFNKQMQPFLLIDHKIDAGSGKLESWTLIDGEMHLVDLDAEYFTTFIKDRSTAKETVNLRFVDIEDVFFEYLCFGFQTLEPYITENQTLKKYRDARIESFNKWFESFLRKKVQRGESIIVKWGHITMFEHTPTEDSLLAVNIERLKNQWIRVYMSVFYAVFNQKGRGRVILCTNEGILFEVEVSSTQEKFQYRKDIEEFHRFTAKVFNISPSMKTTLIDSPSCNTSQWMIDERKRSAQTLLESLTQQAPILSDGVVITADIDILNSLRGIGVSIDDTVNEVQFQYCSEADDQVLCRFVEGQSILLNLKNISLNYHLVSYLQIPKDTQLVELEFPYLSGYILGWLESRKEISYLNNQPELKTGRHFFSEKSYKEQRELGRELLCRLIWVSSKDEFEELHRIYGYGVSLEKWRSLFNDWIGNLSNQFGMYQSCISRREELSKEILEGVDSPIREEKFPLPKIAQRLFQAVQQSVLQALVDEFNGKVRLLDVTLEKAFVLADDSLSVSDISQSASTKGRDLPFDCKIKVRRL